MSEAINSESDWRPQTPRARIMSWLAEQAADLSIPFDDVMGHCRKHSLVAIRHELWLRTVEHLYDPDTFSYTRIGALFDRDHSSIIHGCERARKRRAALQV